MSIVLSPKTTVNILPATTKVKNTSQRVLVLADIGTGASGIAGTLYKDVRDPPFNAVAGTPLWAPEKLFGLDSLIPVMIRKFRAINKVTPIDVIPIGVTVGTPSTAKFTIATEPTADGIISIEVSSPDYRYDVAILDADTAAQVATKIQAAIAADTSSLVTATESLGVVTLTPKQIGRSSNSASQFRILSTPTGITFSAIELDAPVSVAFDFPGLLDVIGDTRYQTILFPYGGEGLTVETDPAGAGIGTYLNNSWNADGKVRDTQVFTGYGFDQSKTNSAETASPLINRQQVCFYSDIGPDFSTTPINGLSAPVNVCLANFEVTAAILAKVAAIRSLRLSSGEPIAQFVNLSNGLLDSFGGPALASKPYFNTPIPGITRISGVGFGFSNTEDDGILTNGLYTIGPNSANTAFILSQVPTTYQTDIAGNVDISFQFLNFVDTISNAREYFSNNLKSRFSQSRLTSGDIIRGRDMANDETISAFCEVLYQDLSGKEFVLVESGEQAFAFFKRNLAVTINLSTGRATVDMIVPIVTQLREIIATMQISFGTEG